MAYDGEYREYPAPCLEGRHQQAYNGSCFVCGVQCDYDGLSLREAELRKLRRENARLKSQLAKLKGRKR